MANESTGTVTVERVDANSLRLFLRAVAPGGGLGDATVVVRRGEPNFDLFEPHVGKTVSLDDEGKVVDGK